MDEVAFRYDLQIRAVFTKSKAFEALDAHIQREALTFLLSKFRKLDAASHAARRHIRVRSLIGAYDQCLHRSSRKFIAEWDGSHVDPDGDNCLARTSRPAPSAVSHGRPSRDDAMQGDGCGHVSVCQGSRDPLAVLRQPVDSHP